MREVINYEPDIFTRCFHVLPLPVGHGCQHIFSSCLFCIAFLPPPSSPSVSQGGCGVAALPGLTAFQNKKLECATVTAAVRVRSFFFLVRNGYYLDSY